MQDLQAAQNKADPSGAGGCGHRPGSETLVILGALLELANEHEEWDMEPIELVTWGAKAIADSDTEH